MNSVLYRVAIKKGKTEYPTWDFEDWDDAVDFAFILAKGANTVNNEMYSYVVAEHINTMEQALAVPEFIQDAMIDGFIIDLGIGNQIKLYPLPKHSSYA